MLTTQILFVKKHAPLVLAVAIAVAIGAVSWASAQTSAAETIGDITICGRPGTDNFNACYYQGRNFDTFKMQRTDSQINFDWGAGSPNPVLEPENFSVRWLGLFDFDAATYEFTVTADDGVRLTVDNDTILDKWIDQPATTYTVRKAMAGGENRGVIVQYYENGGDAVIQVSWRKVSDSEPPPPAPTSAKFYPNAAPSAWYLLPGQMLSFSGSGFAPNETITIQGDSGTATAAADESGRFSAQNVVTIPYSWAESSRSFTIMGSVSGSAASPNPIVVHLGTFYPQLNPSAWWIGHNQNMSAMASDFGPNERITLSANDVEIAQLSADASGSANFNFTTPGSGEQATLTVRGTGSGLSVSRTIYLHP